MQSQNKGGAAKHLPLSLPPQSCSVHPSIAPFSLHAPPDNTACVHTPFFSSKPWRSMAEVPDEGCSCPMTFSPVRRASNHARHGKQCKSFYPAPPLSIYLSSWKQCAAETTQRSAISVPPQMWRPRTCRLACHGHSPSTEFIPPTILLRGACIPQSEEETQQVLQGRKGTQYTVPALPFLLS